MPTTLSPRTTAINCIAGLFILLFTYAGVSKLADYQKFSVELGKSPLLTSFSGFIAWSIPVVEILISLLLMMPAYQLLALYASFTLMVLFTAYLVTTLQFADYIPCTCGGVLQNLTWQTHIIFNCCFIALAIAAILLHKVT
ncbi:MAG: hypothetical protein JNK79_06830, partial [Chitinophagaceae bacterium]|nr:hypothetical protein [Chitinophagaceae bacterium]